MLQWKRFQFFDKQSLELTSSSASLLKEISCVSGGEQFAAVGGADGAVLVLGEDNAQLSFQAHEFSVEFLVQCSSTPTLLLSVGRSSVSSMASVRLWRFASRPRRQPEDHSAAEKKQRARSSEETDGDDDATGTTAADGDATTSRSVVAPEESVPLRAPRLVAEYLLQRSQGVPVMAAALAGDRARLAVGLSNGAVLLLYVPSGVRGGLEANETRTTASSSGTDTGTGAVGGSAQARQLLLQQPGADSVTACEFVRDDVLLVVGLARVLRYEMADFLRQGGGGAGATAAAAAAGRHQRASGGGRRASSSDGGRRASSSDGGGETERSDTLGIRRRNVDTERGAELGCSCLWAERAVVVCARADAIRLYGAHGIGTTCMSLEGNKRQLAAQQSYLCVISTVDVGMGGGGGGGFGPAARHDSARYSALPETGGGAPGGTTAALLEHQRSVGSLQPRLGSRLQQVHIYDPQNKFIAFTGAFERVERLWQGYGDSFLVLSGAVGRRRLYRLREQTLSSQLQLLARKKLFPTAISLGISRGLPYDRVLEIFASYGDFLYNKGDYGGAIKQYIRALRILSPSDVIDKFLVHDRIGHLATYLQALHREERAAAEHTGLLLHCYIRLEDGDRLNQFVRDRTLRFEVAAAVEVCRRAGYLPQALHLATAHRAHTLAVDVLLNDLQCASAAASYLTSLLPGDAAQALLAHGRRLLRYCPMQLSLLARDLCTGQHQASTQSPRLLAMELNAELPPAQHIPFEELFDEYRSSGPATASATAPLPTSASASTSSSVSASSSKSGADAQADATLRPPQRTHASIPFASATNQQRLLPEDLFSVYAERPLWLTWLLYEVVNTALLCSPKVYTTLLRLCLEPSEDLVPSSSSSSTAAATPSSAAVTASTGTSAASASSPAFSVERPRDLPTSRAEWQAIASSLLESPRAHFDNEEALLLCQRNLFERGVLLMYVRMRRHYDVLFHAVERQRPDDVMACCRRFGGEDPSLWVAALKFCCRPDSGASVAQLHEAMEHVHQDRTVSSVMLLDMLATHPAMTVDDVRPFLLEELEQQDRHYEDFQYEVRHLNEDLRGMQMELDQLTRGARIFQFSKCTACMAPLDLPAEHFLCGHAFHQRCLLEDERHCLLCQPQRETWEELLASLDHSRSNHAEREFLNLLDGSRDGFEAVAMYFGKGVFDATQ